MTMPTSVQDSALHAIDGAVTNLIQAHECVRSAIELARKHGLDGDEIRGAFERAGLDFAGVLAACEAVA